MTAEPSKDIIIIQLPPTCETSYIILTPILERYSNLLNLSTIFCDRYSLF